MFILSISRKTRPRENIKSACIINNQIQTYIHLSIPKQFSQLFSLGYEHTMKRICCFLESLWHESNKCSMACVCFFVNTLRLRQNGRHFPDDICKCIFLNENAWISIKISLKFVPKGPINKISALVQIMAWRRSGDKPLSEPMMVSLLRHICVTWPQWVNCWDMYVGYMHVGIVMKFE